MVGPHEHAALKLHSSIDLYFRLSRLAIKSNLLKAQARALDEQPSEAMRLQLRDAIFAVDKAIADTFMQLEEIDDLVNVCRERLLEDDRPDAPVPGLEYLGGEEVIDRMAALYGLDRHKP